MLSSRAHSIRVSGFGLADSPDTSTCKHIALIKLFFFAGGCLSSLSLPLDALSSESCLMDSLGLLLTLHIFIWLVPLFCPICEYWPMCIWDIPYVYTHMGCPYVYGTTFCHTYISILFACHISLQVFGYCCYK